MSRGSMSSGAGGRSGAAAFSAAAVLPLSGASREQAPKQQRRVAVHRTSPVQASLYYQLPPALVGLNEGDFQLSVPALALGQVYSPRQLAEFGVKQQTELSMPVFNWVF